MPTAPGQKERPYANPYVAGAGLGLVLLASFVVAGRGLGASGAFASVAAATASSIAPASVAANPYFSGYRAAGSGPWSDWLVWELVGVAIGGLLSAALAGRAHLRIERGARISAPARLVVAGCGGAVMGGGAVLARGCTSGQALTGGALLSAGSWLFMMCAFAGGYAAAPLVRRAWR